MSGQSKWYNTVIYNGITIYRVSWTCTINGCKIPATSKMELFAESLIPGHLTIVTKSSMLDIVRVLDPPLREPYGHVFCISNIL